MSQSPGCPCPGRCRCSWTVCVLRFTSPVRHSSRSLLYRYRRIIGLVCVPVRHGLDDHFPILCRVLNNHKHSRKPKPVFPALFANFDLARGVDDDLLRRMVLGLGVRRTGWHPSVSQSYRHRERCRRGQWVHIVGREVVPGIRWHCGVHCQKVTTA